MSRRQALAGVLTLKATVPPGFTLMSVAKPWMVASPAPLTSQVDCAVPARQFSASMALAGEAQDAPATRGMASSSAPAARAPARLLAGGSVLGRTAWPATGDS